jgi:molybdate transport system substrate-binding protein
MKISSKVLSITKSLACVGVVATASYAHAEDMTFLCANNLQQAVMELKDEFEKASGHNVRVTYASIGTNAERVRNGEYADLAIVSASQWESLQKDGKLAPGTPVVISKIGIGVFGKKGAPRPDISSVDAFKRMLLEARSIALGDPKAGAPVSVYLLPLFERLGISADITPKIRFTSAPGPFAITDVVKNGDAEVGFTQVTNILASQDVDFIGPLPPEIQNFTSFTAVIPATVKQAEAANALVQFLKSPRGIAVLKSKGFETD